MLFKKATKLFESHEGYRQFKKSVAGPNTPTLNMGLLRDRAVKLAEQHEHRAHVLELRKALHDFTVNVDPQRYQQVSLMLEFLAETVFRDISEPVSSEIKHRIVDYKGPKFFFVGHTSYFDYVLAARSVRKLGVSAPIIHASGSVSKGRAAYWLKGFRSLIVPKSMSVLQHRAYSWFSAALAESLEPQILMARTSRYTVRSRDGILREPYVPHSIVAGVKATGRALVVPISISYSAIPEDSFLTVQKLFPVLSMVPNGWALLPHLLVGLGNSDSFFEYIEGVFSDVNVSVCDPFELENNDSFALQRISHRAIEEIAKNKMILPSQLVARAMQSGDRLEFKAIRDSVEKEIENINLFFKSRYRKNPPYHPTILSDVPEAVNQGIKVLTKRGAVSHSIFRRNYSAGNPFLLRFYSYHADRRIYPLSGRNTLTVINAGVWGYTLALHIGQNLLRQQEMAEHSLILYDSREDIIEKLTVEGKHPWHFKDIPLPRSVRPEADLIAAVGDTSLILIVTPSKYFYSTLTKVLEMAPDGSDLVIATKGFIPETGLLPCQTARREMERFGKKMTISALSGANLAHEIVQGGACVTQVACESYDTFERLLPLLETPLFRVVHSGDVIGTTISAALKNVYAIGFGILEGSKKAPENFLATYSTLVTAEIRQFGLLLGASPETFDAESQVWMADLLATCRGGRSARFGRDLADMEEKAGKVRPVRLLIEQYRKKKIAIEGYEASRFAKRIASQRGFYPPILGEIYSILHGGKQLNISEFIEKCLDALVKKTAPATPSITRTRSARY